MGQFLSSAPLDLSTSANRLISDAKNTPGKVLAGVLLAGVLSGCGSAYDASAAQEYAQQFASLAGCPLLPAKSGSPHVQEEWTCWNFEDEGLDVNIYAFSSGEDARRYLAWLDHSRETAPPAAKVLPAYQWPAHPTIVVSLASEDPKEGEAVQRLLGIQAGG